MTALLIVSLVVLVFSAFASGAEAAVFSVSPSKARAMAAAGKGGGKLLLSIKQDMSRTIATIVILNNISNIVGSAVIGVLAARVLEPAWLAAYFAAFTLAIILFAEILPKTVGEAHAPAVALLVARPVRALRVSFAPALWIIEKIVHPFHRGKKRTVSEEEIKVMAQMGRETGAIEHDEARLVQRVFKLNDITAEDMMTPRQQMEAVPSDKTLMELRPYILDVRHSRLPVFEDDLDTIVGVVLLRDLLAALAQDRFAARPTDLMQEVAFVRHDTLADDLLPLFQKQEQHLAVVVDENGKVDGVITLEDVLEELVGEITDETDIRPENIRRVSKTEIVVDEATEIPRINDFFNVAIEGDGMIGDHVVERFGRRLKVGDVFREKGLEYRVVAMRRTRPKHISIRKTFDV